MACESSPSELGGAASRRRRAAGRAPPPGPATRAHETGGAVDGTELGLRHDVVRDHGVITQSYGTLAEGPVPLPARIHVREMDDEPRIRLRLEIGGFDHRQPSQFLLGRTKYSA